MAVSLERQSGSAANQEGQGLLDPYEGVDKPIAQTLRLIDSRVLPELRLPTSPLAAMIQTGDRLGIGRADKYPSFVNKIAIAAISENLVPLFTRPESGKMPLIDADGVRMLAALARAREVWYPDEKALDIKAIVADTVDALGDSILGRKFRAHLGLDVEQIVVEEPVTNGVLHEDFIELTNGVVHPDLGPSTNGAKTRERKKASLPKTPKESKGKSASASPREKAGSEVKQPSTAKQQAINRVVDEVVAVARRDIQGHSLQKDEVFVAPTRKEIVIIEAMKDPAWWTFRSEDRWGKIDGLYASIPSTFDEISWRSRGVPYEIGVMICTKATSIARTIWPGTRKFSFELPGKNITTVIKDDEGKERVVTGYQEDKEAVDVLTESAFREALYLLRRYQAKHPWNRTLADIPKMFFEFDTPERAMVRGPFGRS